MMKSKCSQLAMSKQSLLSFPRISNSSLQSRRSQVSNATSNWVRSSRKSAWIKSKHQSATKVTSKCFLIDRKDYLSYKSRTKRSMQLRGKSNGRLKYSINRCHRHLSHNLYRSRSKNKNQTCKACSGQDRFINKPKSTSASYQSQ